MMSFDAPEHSLLGKKADYPSNYDPNLLFSMPRQPKRDEIGVRGALPFSGFDVWNHYEVSWLNAKGKPIVAMAVVVYSCDSPYIIESKSMKLYFNAFNNVRFETIETVQQRMEQDIRERVQGTYVRVLLMPLAKMAPFTVFPRLSGIHIDALDIECDHYHTHPDYLCTDKEIVEETLCSDLLKSNCRVTNQPDWCSIQIEYKGPRIQQEGLLRYLVSFRNDNEFHEQCIEKIFMHLLTRCKPHQLTVRGYSTRRGGIDINSSRSTQTMSAPELPIVRLCRQ